MPKESNELGSKKPKVLIVDDEATICNLLKDILNDEGYEVRFTQDAREGLELVKNNSFDIVISDIRMPRIDGIDILSYTKKFDPDISVILMTGYASIETAQKAIRFGASDYITKPFQLKEIPIIVERALRSHQLKLENKRLMKQLEETNLFLEQKVDERTEEISTLYKIGREVSSSLSIDEVLNTVLQRTTSVLNAKIGTIFLFEKEKRMLFLRAYKGIKKKDIRDIRLKLGEKVSGWVAKKDKLLLVKDISKDRRFRNIENESFYKKSLISQPLKSKGKIIGVINISNKKSKDGFTKDDEKLLRAIALESSIAIENALLYSRLSVVYMQTIKALATALEARDGYHHSHSENVTKYAVKIAKELHLSPKRINIIEEACQLHDLGKIGIPDAILQKKSTLNEKEWEIIKTHSSKGANILSPLAFLKEVRELVSQHHERFDGRGYPDGRRGRKIKLGARIMAVADSIDAMISNRPYRKGLTLKETINELKKNSGTQFDPRIVKICLKLLKKNPSVIELSRPKKKERK